MLNNPHSVQDCCRDQNSHSSIISQCACFSHGFCKLYFLLGLQNLCHLLTLFSLLLYVSLTIRRCQQRKTSTPIRGLIPAGPKYGIRKALMFSLIFLVPPQLPVDSGRILSLFHTPEITLAFEILFVLA